MNSYDNREARFLEITDRYKEVIAKVCILYSGPSAPFDDLYQEVLANLWEGIDSFRGEAKISTWIYRAAINTCITWHRRNDRHSRTSVSIEDLVVEPADSSGSSEYLAQLQMLHDMISQLGPLEKALITLWLDEKPYDEIALITGLSRANVAVKIHRIKDKLSQMANS